MKRINEENLIQELKQQNVEPSSDWMRLTAEHLYDFAKNDVTTSTLKRKKWYEAFYLLLSTKMNLQTKIIAGVITGALVFTSGGVVLANSANSARPGDFLFPLDKALESVQRSFAKNQASKATTELNILHERVTEAESLTPGSDNYKLALAEISQQKDTAQSEVEKEQTEDGKVDTTNEQLIKEYDSEINKLQDQTKTSSSDEVQKESQQVNELHYEQQDQQETPETKQPETSDTTEKEQETEKTTKTTTTTTNSGETEQGGESGSDD